MTEEMTLLHKRMMRDYTAKKLDGEGLQKSRQYVLDKYDVGPNYFLNIWEEYRMQNIYRPVVIGVL